MKILKKILKITGIVFASIILFMILLVVGAKIFESELASIAMTELESEIEAPMSIGKVSLIPLFSFPRISAEINNLWIGDPKSTESDTLFYINSLKVGLDSWDLFKGIYTIDKVEISGLDFDYVIGKNGKSNIDFLLDAFVDTTAKLDADLVNPNDTLITPLDLTAEKLKLENIRVHYYDSVTHTASQVYIPEINLKVKAKNDIYKVKTEGSIVLSKLLFEGTKLDQMKSCTVDFDLEHEGNDATINKLDIRSEGIELGVQVRARLGDTLLIDATLEAHTLDFDILKKYLPDEYKSLLDGTRSDLSPFTVDVNMEYAGNDAIINKLLIKSDGIDLGLKGAINLGDTLTVDATFDANTLDIDVLKEFIPKQYFEEYGIIDIGGLANASARIKGKYADSTLLPLVDANVKLKKIRIQTRDYPEIKTLNLEARVTNGNKMDMSEAVINIAKLDVKTPLSSVYLDGTIRGIDSPRYNINTTLDINLAEFETQIPDSLARNLEGNINASIKTSGILPEKIPDDFVDYVLDKTTLSITFNEVSGLLMDSLQIDSFGTAIKYSPQLSGDKNIDIKNLNLKSEALNVNLNNSSLTAILSGKFSVLSSLGVDLQSFRFQNGSNLIVGNAEISNFETPEFDINTNIFLKLEELMAFTPDSVVKNMTGTIKAGIRSHGKIHLDSLETQLYPILFENSSFDLSFNNIGLSFPDSIMDVDGISARISMENDVLNIDDFSANYNGLSLEMDSTIVQNIYKAMLLNQKEELYVKIHIKLGDIFYDNFKHLMAIEDTDPDISGSTTLEDEPQNWTFLVHGTAAVNSFIMDSTIIEGYTINQLHVNDLSTLFKLTDSTYIFDQFKFKAFEGEMNNSFHYKIREDGTQSVSTRNVIQQMNIRTLLRDMDNFGMDSLSNYEHISGLLSTDLNTFVPIDDSVLIDKMLVSGDLVLEKGGVYDYPPAQEISSLPGLKDLDNLQFKTLRSNIFMFKSNLYVPRTNIVSNEIDIAAFGMQGMDYDCEYHLEVHLGNILFGKSKKRNKKQEESGEEIDEESLKKASHKIRYTEIKGDVKVKRDTKESREAMMNKIRVQQKMLDFIFFPKNIHYSTAVDKKN
jgi:hypothetical protein